MSLPTHTFPEELQAEADRLNIRLEFLMVTSDGNDMNMISVGDNVPFDFCIDEMRFIQ